MACTGGVPPRCPLHSQPHQALPQLLFKTLLGSPVPSRSSPKPRPLLRPPSSPITSCFKLQQHQTGPGPQGTPCSSPLPCSCAQAWDILPRLVPLDDFHPPQRFSGSLSCRESPPCLCRLASPPDSRKESCLSLSPRLDRRLLSSPPPRPRGCTEDCFAAGTYTCVLTPTCQETHGVPQGRAQAHILAVWPGAGFWTSLCLLLSCGVESL